MADERTEAMLRNNRAFRDAMARKTEPCESVICEDMSVHTCYLPSGHDRDHTNGIKTWPVVAAVTEYSVKIWYRSGAYEGDSHCPEELARKIYADAVASDGVEFAELHGPSGMLVESKVPHTCNAAGDAPNSQGTERCDLPTGHAGRHYEGNLTWPNRNEEQHVSDPDEWTEPQGNEFLAGLPLLHPEPLPPAPELSQEPEPSA